ncbi:Vegetative incompatibility protein HET-E-1 [Colletotrichum siamense]|nr:Vegetative incompatibility protein HET-E-1 [Colletotrichum siamense]
MRLIETTTLAMETYLGKNIPRYAILSHTWEDEEVTLQDWNSPTREGMKGFHKIRMTCQLAASDGIRYAWVDTCCIDKSNSAELSEAINSMYMWYKSASVCYAYLSDLRLSASAKPENIKSLKALLRGCRWFSRGWTLQELIAPDVVLFYQQDWGLVGDKGLWSSMLSDVTGISSNAIYHYDPADHSIASRMSWAAGRETTRVEDRAYCLLGIFNVNMPMLYGEGTKAFRRLQEEILRTGYDLSIFAWSKTMHGTNPSLRLLEYTERHPFISGAFAEAPENFYSVPAHMIRRQWMEMSVINSGVRLKNFELCLVRRPQTGKLSYILPVCSGGWEYTGKGISRGKNFSALGVGLKMMTSGRFVREDHGRLVEIPEDGKVGMVRRIRLPDAHILLDLPSKMTLGWTREVSNRPYFAFPPGCRVVKAWPSGSWNDVDSTFMAIAEEPNYGSLLLEVRIPLLSEDNEDDDSSVMTSRSGEFVFLFGSFTDPDYPHVRAFEDDLEYTIVGYRDHQWMLDIINLRMGAGDMNVKEMRRTLRNFAIPKQRGAAVPVEGTEQYIYTSVDFESGGGFTFRSSSVALENEQHPRCV